MPAPGGTDVKPIYLDYNATTPIAPEVAAAIRPFLEREFGNPSSAHPYGRRAHAAVEEARAQVASLLGCAMGEVVFTGGGSEANNHAIKGIAEALRDGGRCAAPGVASAGHTAKPGRGSCPLHIITTAIEHPAVLQPCRYLERRGFQVTYLGVDEGGRVDPEAVREALTERTILVTVMHANNEVGTLEPIAEIAAIAHERGVLVHTDAAQSAGKIPTDVGALGVDLLSVAGHKLYAPKGIGALYVRAGIALEPLIHGAGHESGRRAGTENLLGIAGLGAACALARAELPEREARLRALRDRLRDALGARVPGLARNGDPKQCLPNTLNVSFPSIAGDELLRRTPEIAASTGSACHAGHTEPSPVLKAMGLSDARALGAVRLSVGRETTVEEIDQAASLLAARSRG
jgi:cysteine desulfurase